MDPLTLTASIVSIAAIATNIARLVQNLSKTNDPSIKLIRAKLMGERRKFANWMLVMRISTMKDLERKILPEDYKDVKELVNDIVAYFKEASIRLKNLDLRSGKYMSPKAIAARLRWIYGEFDDLKLLAETIETLNSTLYAIAEPPPKYGIGPDSPRSTPRIIRDTQPAPFTLRNPGTESSLEGHTTPSRDESLRAPSVPPNRRPILNLYERCLKALNFISSQTNSTTHSEDAEKVTFRMKTWAVEFFDGSYSIDRILMKEKDRIRVNEPVRTAIIGTLVDIALIEGRLN